LEFSSAQKLPEVVHRHATNVLLSHVDVSAYCASNNLLYLPMKTAKSKQNNVQLPS